MRKNKLFIAPHLNIIPHIVFPKKHVVREWMNLVADAGMLDICWMTWTNMNSVIYLSLLSLPSESRETPSYRKDMFKLKSILHPIVWYSSSDLVYTGQWCPWR